MKILQIIKNNKNYFIKIFTSLILFATSLIFIFYIIYTYITYSNNFYALRYEYSKGETNIFGIYKKLKPNIVYDKKNEIIYKFDKKGNIIYTYYDVFPIGIKFNDIYITFFHNKILLGFKLKQYYIYKDIFCNFYTFLHVFSIIIYLLLFGVFLIIIEIINNENKKTLLKLANIEALATNNSMAILTENIHHELNTPLDVLENKYQKLKKDIQKYFNNEINKKDLEQNIKNIDNYINLSIEQIRGILDNMRDFKKLRFSNGNKTIYDLIEGSIKIMKVTYNSNFHYEIDKRFKNYKLDHSTKMKNSDLINILLNHLKNSLEANATMIRIYMKEYRDGKLSFIIEDDGNGIPKNIQKKIYDANFSTKDDSVGLRGNGMFLNKNLLNAFGGDEKLLWSEVNKGTKFLITIPAIKLTQ